jgi:hypothetical protein
MSQTTDKSPVQDAFKSAVAGSLAAAADRNHGCMIASRSSQANALPFADVCTNGFGWSVRNILRLAQKLVQMSALDNVAPRTSAASYMFGHVRSVLQITAQKWFRRLSAAGILTVQTSAQN